jgi:UDP-glucose 4-epimerase
MGRTMEKVRVAITGATGDLGQLLIPLLEQDERVERVLAIDVAKPNAHGAKVDYRRIELAHPGADTRLAMALAEGSIGALFHLAFLYGRVHNPNFAHELEVIGSMNVLSALSRAPVRRLVIPSITALYGARPNNPALLREDAPLAGCAGSRFINDKVEVEAQLEAFRRKNPEFEMVVLRFAPIVGPTVNNPVTRLLRNRVVPTLLGFDPLWQVIHEEDAAAALHHALFSPATGIFNVVGPGVLSLSGLVRSSGGAVVPLPHPFARAALRLLEVLGMASVPAPLLDYIHYNWLADSSRSETELGFVPTRRGLEAATSMRGS